MRIPVSVILCQSEDFSFSQKISYQNWDPVGGRFRAGIFIAIALIHVAFVLALATTSYVKPVIGPSPENLVTIFMRPKVIVSREFVVNPEPIQISVDAPLALNIPISEGDESILSVIGVGTMAPYAVQNSDGSAIFARQAGLAAGQGATVVLRVEVLETNQAGRIEIDVSGGSHQVDEAAIAYVRALPWISGRIEGKPTTLWIRWGVRLEA